MLIFKIPIFKCLLKNYNRPQIKFLCIFYLDTLFSSVVYCPLLDKECHFSVETIYNTQLEFMK